MGKFCQFLTELSASHTSIFSFLVNNFSKYQCIFIKLGMCIDIVEICFGVANVQISSIFISHHKIVVGYYGLTLAVPVSVHLSVFSFPDDNLSKCQWIFTKLGVCIDIG